MQTGLPMTAAALAAGPSKLKPQQPAVLSTQLLPCAVRAGSQCHDLMSIYYENHVDDNLVDLRQRWRIIEAPPFIEQPTSAPAPPH